MSEKASEEWRQEKITFFQELRRKGKFVGILEYTRDPGQMNTVRQKAKKYGLFPYFAEENLESLYE